MNKNLTIVTGIWDLKRDQAGDGFQRSFDHYVENFKKLLQADIPMIVFIEDKYKHIVEECRQGKPTDIKIRETDSFKKGFDFYDKVQAIRTDKDWLGQASWLKDSTQGSLDLYNPMVMSKFFLLNDSAIWNPFNTDYFAWIDGGITNTVHPGYFTHDMVFDKVIPYLEKFFFISFPYEDGPEIHGFNREKITEYCDVDHVKYVCRGGFFGGHKDYIADANGLYYGLLSRSLEEGYMGTEESIFTIMAHQEPEIYKRFHLKPDHAGLISNFFEDVKNQEVVIEKPQITIESKRTKKRVDLSKTKTSLYVITFNSAAQLNHLLDGWTPAIDEDCDIFVLDNSTDKKAIAENKKTCKKFGAKRLRARKGNIGICGGRQYIAEHFHKSKADYYIFLEDDMNLNKNDFQGKTCQNGMTQFVDNLYTKVHKIMAKENYDFLKFSFTEFYGDNITQFSWYNVPEDVRQEFWPGTKLPKQGLSKDAPLTRFNNIGVVDGLPYIDGDVYYCNWPQIVSREGNKKMFIDTKFANPFEQTWMSFMFQEARKGNLFGAILLASPITHHRFDHYDGKDRREN